jgi:dTDP-4-amino-4,6-dideoxygalactose transaminase
MVISNTTKYSPTFIPHSRPTLGQEEVRAVAEVIKSGHIAEGEAVWRFEKVFAQKIGVEDAVAVSSGTAALHLALLAMGIGPEHEVIIPSYVCSALLHAVKYVGAQPVPAEIDPLTYNIDPDDVKRRITTRTKAIIVPHMFGLTADLDELLKLAIPIIEDCAQAVGGTYHQKPLGTFGDAAIFSFYATKMMATGEGGMVTSQSPGILARIRDLKTYDGKVADRVRYNYKMTDVQAATGQIQLARLEGFIEQRRKIARLYVKRLKSLNIKLPVETAEHIYYRFVIGLETDCDGFIQKLAQKAVGCARPVFLPIHRHLKKDGYPITDKIWQTSLSIPIYPSLSNSEIEQIIAGFIGIYEKYERSAAD